MNNLESSNQCEAAPVGSEIVDEIRVEIDTFQTCSSSPLHVLTYHDKSENAIGLHQAAFKGDWEKAYKIIHEQNEIVKTPINSKMDTALHIAVAAKHEKFVKNLLGEMDRDDLALRNKDKNTSLCFAASSGVVKIANMLIEKNPELPNIKGSKSMTPILIAALFGHGEMVRYLKRETKIEDLNDTETRNLFLAIISAGIYDVALWMWEKMDNLEVLNHCPKGEKETALHLMARKHSAISKKSQLNVFQNLANSIGLCHDAKMRTLAHQLVEKLWQSVMLLPEEKVSKLLESPSMLLFDAAKSGNLEFLVILIRSNPDVVWMADEKSRSLFHVAALNRQIKIFNLIYELGGVRDLIASYEEKESENNLLHLVSFLPPPKRLQVVSGAALQMQRELLWFKAAEKIVPRSYITTKNTEKNLAHDLFTTQHEKLRKEGEKWMKDTATACMLVATLIATMVFAAAFTLPGGNVGSDEKNNTKVGFPQFRYKFWFDVFIVSDSIALLSSVTTIMIFLSILTSRYAEDDFQMTLPVKLLSGLVSLFASIITMVLAFTAAMILIRDNEPKWSLILIICLSSLAVISFAFFNFRFLRDILRSVFCSSFLFHGCKTGLFH